MATLHALLTDSYAMDAPIYLFTHHIGANRALESFHWGNPFIVNCPYHNRGSKSPGFIFLALTMEDTGVRIHAAFYCIAQAHAFQADHVTESRCVIATGWLEPTIAALAATEKLRCDPETGTYQLGAA
ncbi:MAG: hypothetical protein H6591_06235 [Flavobacteriales bacterium]|nr:hypothetical protein [Flavobacteriales bacterium]